MINNTKDSYQSLIHKERQLKEEHNIILDKRQVSIVHRAIIKKMNL